MATAQEGHGACGLEASKISRKVHPNTVKSARTGPADPDRVHHDARHTHACDVNAQLSTMLTPRSFG